jgi:hypothetical protein
MMQNYRHMPVPEKPLDQRRLFADQSGGEAVLERKSVVKKFLKFNF